MSDYNFSRRKFLAGAATVGAAGAMGIGTLSSCSGGGSTASAEYDWMPREYKYPPLLDEVPAGTVLKAGVVGCGGRGTGAALNFLEAGGSTVQVTALADVFKDRLDSCAEKIKTETGQEVPAENCFLGFDAYEKVLDSGVDIVILATPPKFRPQPIRSGCKSTQTRYLWRNLLLLILLEFARFWPQQKWPMLPV